MYPAPGSAVYITSEPVVELISYKYTNDTVIEYKLLTSRFYMFSDKTNCFGCYLKLMHIAHRRIYHYISNFQNWVRYRCAGEHLKSRFKIRPLMS